MYVTAVSTNMFVYLNESVAICHHDNYGILIDSFLYDAAAAACVVVRSKFAENDDESAATSPVYRSIGSVHALTDYTDGIPLFMSASSMQTIPLCVLTCQTACWTRKHLVNECRTFNCFDQPFLTNRIIILNQKFYSKNVD